MRQSLHLQQPAGDPSRGAVGDTLLVSPPARGELYLQPHYGPLLLGFCLLACCAEALPGPSLLTAAATTSATFQQHVYLFPVMPPPASPAFACRPPPHFVNCTDMPLPAGAGRLQQIGKYQEAELLRQQSQHSVRIHLTSSRWQLPPGFIHARKVQRNSSLPPAF